MKEKKWNAVLILNVLMRADRALSTYEICEMVGCNRKTVYACMDILECSGFPIVIGKTTNCGNSYRWSGEVCGF